MRLGWWEVGQVRVSDRQRFEYMRFGRNLGGINCTCKRRCSIYSREVQNTIEALARIATAPARAASRPELALDLDVTLFCLLPFFSFPHFHLNSMAMYYVLCSRHGLAVHFVGRPPTAVESSVRAAW